MRVYWSSEERLINSTTMGETVKNREITGATGSVRTWCWLPDMGPMPSVQETFPPLRATITSDRHTLNAGAIAISAKCK